MSIDLQPSEIAKAGKAKEGKGDLQKAIELAPESTEANEARGLLKQIK